MIASSVFTSTPRERFVEKNDATVLGKRPGQEDPLLLAAGQLADLALAEFAHADPCQRRFDSVVIGLFRDAQHVHAAVTAHHHHVFDENRKVPVHLFGLRHIGDEVLPQCLRDRHSQDGDVALRQPHEAHDRLEERRLAAAVDADKGGDRAGGDFEGGIAQCPMTIAVGHRGSADANAAPFLFRSCFRIGAGHFLKIHCDKPFAIVSDVTRSRSI